MIKYHFFGKEIGLESVYSQKSIFAAKIAEQGFFTRKNQQLPSLMLLNQVHGNEVIIIDDIAKIYDEKSLPKVDAITCNLSGIALAVITADCAPVLFFDEEKQIIAAAHAGWRGAKAGILEAAVSSMRNLGANHISAAIGPMIQQESYEVSTDFVADFLAENPDNKKFFQIVAKEGNSKPQSETISKSQDQKSLFDLSGYVEAKLNLLGIAKIDNMRIDTYSNEQKFFSYRRSCHLGKKHFGQNVAVIAIL